MSNNPTLRTPESFLDEVAREKEYPLDYFNADPKETKEFILEAMRRYGEAGKSKWISVEDALPEHNQDVLTYTLASNDTEEMQRILKFGSIGNGFPSGVTHWMPLIIAPKI